MARTARATADHGEGRDSDTFSALPQITRRTQVVDALREAIVSGRLQPGTKITELSLAERFAISRGPIREAIRELTNEGLLVSRPYSATHVAAVDERTITEAYDLRRLLEVYAWRLAWPRRDARLKTVLMERHETLQRTLGGGDVFAEISAELAFHSTAFEFSGSDLLIATWRPIAQRIQLSFSVYQVAIGGPASGEHQRYMEAALGDDFEALHREVERHIDQGMAGVRTFFAKKKRKTRAIDGAAP